MSLFGLSLEATEVEKDKVDQNVEKSTLEAIENEGKSVREKEHQLFARLLDFSQLKSANKAEIQEQYSVNVDRTEENAGEGQIRVRKITDRSKNTRYEMTIKNKVKEGKIENTNEITESAFIQMQVLSTQGMMKHRYYFPIKGTEYQWEVDAVPDGNGGYYPWVRAEIEVKDLKEKVPEFPLKSEELILPATMGGLDDEAFKEKTQPLLDRFFVIGNPFLKEDHKSETALKGEDQPEEAETSKESTNDEVNNVNDANVEETAEKSLSVDNITDDKEKAEKVEIRSEQIRKAKDEVDPEEGEEGETEDTESDETSEDESGEDATDGEGDDESESTDEDGDSEGEETEKEETTDEDEKDSEEVENSKESLQVSTEGIMDFNKGRSHLSEIIEDIQKIYKNLNGKVSTENAIVTPDYHDQFAPGESDSDSGDQLLADILDNKNQSPVNLENLYSKEIEVSDESTYLAYLKSFR